MPYIVYGQKRALVVLHCCTSYSKQIENKPDKLNTDNLKKIQLFVALSPKIYQGVEGVNHIFKKNHQKFDSFKKQFSDEQFVIKNIF